ncbi:MAG: hypothetical protein ACXWK0_12135, partial [Caulobacteraceae bacterium]
GIELQAMTKARAARRGRRMEWRSKKKRVGRQSKPADTGMMVDLSDTGFYVPPQRKAAGRVGPFRCVLEVVE